MVSYHFVVVDDHPLYRDAVMHVIEDTFLDKTISECASLFELETLLSSLAKPDLILLDLNMPGVQGLSGLQQVRKTAPDIPVAIISAEENRQIILQALALGAVGFISKSLPKIQMGQALEQIIAGDIVLPSDLMRAPTTPLIPTGKTSIESLTHKQLLVLELLAAGHANKRIAIELNLSESTVKTHVSDILRKLGVSNRVQAANQVSGINFDYYIGR